MDILLAVVLISVVEIVVLRLAFRSSERAEEKRARVELEQAVQARPSHSRFFAATGAFAPSQDAPLEAMLARLERHIRVEQEAAEWFVANPTPETLHHVSQTRHLAH